MPPYQHPYSKNLLNDPMKNGCHLERIKSGKRNGSISTTSSQVSKKSCTYTDPLQRFASFLKNRKCKDIIIMAGAGISTASGIPDFRSPGTGLYYNTKKYNVSNPTDVFDLKYFNRNPNPFLDIIRDFIRSEKQPNSIHKFCKTLESHGVLLRMYTQNIDGLEKKCGISSTKLVEAHGTLESASCCKCFAPHSPSWTEKMILAHKVPSCRRKSCSGYVKPDVVMFGEELPKKFYLYPKDFQKCDLLIIMGTSLNVEPFSELVDAVPRKCPRVLLNRDAVGPFADSRRKNDIFVPGDILESLKQVIKLAGWNKTKNSDDDCSSSESSASETESKTWASTRNFREMATEKNYKPPESVCLPNSVIRKSSQHQLVNKMSLLSVESTKTAKTISRRSVSAPIPKTELKASEQTIPTEISGNSTDSLSPLSGCSEKSVGTSVSNENSYNKYCDESDNNITVETTMSSRGQQKSDEVPFSCISGCTTGLSDSPKTLEWASTTVQRDPPHSSLNPNLPQQSNQGTELKASNCLISPVIQLNGDTTSVSLKEKNAEVKEPLGCTDDNAKEDPSFMTMNVLPNHAKINHNNSSSTRVNNLSERRSAPPDTQPDLRYPFSSAVQRVNRKPVQAKPLYNQRRFVQLKESNNKFTRTSSKANGITRRKASKTQIAKSVKKSTGGHEEHQSYSDLLYSETSDIFKKEFNVFLTSEKAETIKSLCSNTKPSTRHKQKSGRRNDTVVSPFSSYKKSNEAVQSKLQKETVPSTVSPWKLSTGTQNRRQLKEISGLRKEDSGKMPKKQIVLHSRPFLKFKRTDRDAFQWKERR
ncbi:uncharacterized protein LOC134820699 [Bolinopsis microptera]|uniref:uncharacterized protein LOC134820699 n=1 Tax=Bolinopsis microptera TaxID=2820187 RepID=UPI003079ECD6